jgi:hypothetical protein
MALPGDFDLRDEDRLPWLETVDEDYAEGPGVIRTIFFVLLGLAAIAAIIYGVYFYQQTHALKGTGALIAAQEGDYKVKPDTPGGMKVEGEGDTAFATSEGHTGGNASIDLKAVPEAPVAGKVAAPAAPAPVAKATSAVPPSAGKLSPPAPTAPAVAKPALPPVSSGAIVQLGSFPSEALANEAWTKSSKRFAYLAPLGKSVQSATVNGHIVYRLRVNAGSAGQASELCGKLKVAGEACFVAMN